MKHTSDETILIYVISEMVKAKQWQVNYFKELFDPEFEQHQGYSIAEAIRRAEDKLQIVKRDVNDYRYWIDNSHRSASDIIEMICVNDEVDFKEALKHFIREELRKSKQYEMWPHILWPIYRMIVQAKWWLDEVTDYYKAVTPKYFLNYN